MSVWASYDCPWPYDAQRPTALNNTTELHCLQDTTLYFGGDSGIPVSGKPELFPKSGDVGWRIKDAWPVGGGDRRMSERDVGKADREGDDISGFIPVWMHTQWLTCINFSLHFWLPPNLRSAIFLRERAKVVPRAKRTAWSQVSSRRARNQLTIANILFFTKTVTCSNLISWGCCSHDCLKMVATFFLAMFCQSLSKHRPVT